jgi:hypothetical protein
VLWVGFCLSPSCTTIEVELKELETDVKNGAVLRVDDHGCFESALLLVCAGSCSALPFNHATGTAITELAPWL